MRLQRIPLILGLALLVSGAAPSAGQTKFPSHPPMRPLPAASNRSMEKGPAVFVDPLKGDDSNAGSEAKPWKTLGHAVKQLQPGDTLYLRGGTYYEHATVTQSGTPEKPITIRSYPKELAILDGGLREFFDQQVEVRCYCTSGIQNLSTPGTDDHLGLVLLGRRLDPLNLGQGTFAPEGLDGMADLGLAEGGAPG